MLLPRISAASIVRMEIRLEVGNRAAMLAALEAIRSTLPLPGGRPGRWMCRKRRWGEHPRLIAPADHGFGGQARTAPTEGRGRDLSRARPRLGFATAQGATVANARVTLRIGMEMGSNETIKPAVMAGLASGGRYRHLLHGEPQDRGSCRLQPPCESS
jgi:LysR family transcriptional regulator for metE and metH